MTRRTAGWLVVLGILALAAFALVTLPASALSGTLARAGITAGSFSGSIWSGGAQGLSWHGATLGDLAWRLAPVPLLRGRLAGTGALRRADGTLATRFDVTFDGEEVKLDGLTLSLPLAALDPLPLGLPKGWRGRATGRFDQVHLADGSPVALRGAIDFDELVAPPPRNAPVGSFHVVFPHPAPQPSLSIPQDPANVTAQVSDKGGPYAVDGQLTVSPSRSFSLEGTLAPRGQVPVGMQRSLQLLGPADASGRRQFSVGGTL